MTVPIVGRQFPVMHMPERFANLRLALLACAVLAIIAGMAVGIDAISQSGPDPIPVDDNAQTVTIARAAVADQAQQAKRLSAAPAGSTTPILVAEADDQQRACAAIITLTTPPQDLLDYAHSRCRQPAAAPTSAPT